MMNPSHYTYRVTWSPEDNEHVGLCVEFPSLSWLAETPEQALTGIRQVVADVVADLQTNGEIIPPALADKPGGQTALSFAHAEPAAILG